MKKKCFTLLMSITNSSDPWLVANTLAIQSNSLLDPASTNALGPISVASASSGPTLGYQQNLYIDVQLRNILEQHDANANRAARF